MLRFLKLFSAAALITTSLSAVETDEPNNSKLTAVSSSIASDFEVVPLNVTKRIVSFIESPIDLASLSETCKFYNELLQSKVKARR